MPKRRSSPRSSGKPTSWRPVWRVPLLLLLVMAAWWFLFKPSPDDQDWEQVTTPFSLCAERRSGAERAAGCVVDGDTVAIGFGEDRRRIRLTGFDTPELNGACDAESTLAQTARDRLHEWLAQGPFEWSGADGPPYDRYGRELREVRRSVPGGGTEYLADTMVESGLAAPNGWGGRGEWCD